MYPIRIPGPLLDAFPQDWYQESAYLSHPDNRHHSAYQRSTGDHRPMKTPGKPQPLNQLASLIPLMFQPSYTHRTSLPVLRESPFEIRNQFRGNKYERLRGAQSAKSKHHSPSTLRLWIDRLQHFRSEISSALRPRPAPSYPSTHFAQTRFQPAYSIPSRDARLSRLPSGSLRASSPDFWLHKGM
jgi:hypothetical protein